MRWGRGKGAYNQYFTAFADLHTSQIGNATVNRRLNLHLAQNNKIVVITKHLIRIFYFGNNYLIFYFILFILLFHFICAVSHYPNNSM